MNDGAYENLQLYMDNSSDGNAKSDIDEGSDKNVKVKSSEMNIAVRLLGQDKDKIEDENSDIADNNEKHRQLVNESSKNEETHGKKSKDTTIIGNDEIKIKVENTN